MNAKSQILRKVTVLAAALALCLSACGDDDPATNGSNNGANNGTNNGTNNGATNNGATNNGATNNGVVNNGATNNGATNNGVVNNGTGCTMVSPSLGACDPLCQSGCIAGQACQAASSGPGAPVASACVMAGAGTQGTVCDASNGCAAGYGCLTQQGEAMATCLKYCRLNGAEDPQCDAGTVCAGVDNNIADLGVCAAQSDSCTQFPADSCGDGENCYNTNLGLRCAAFSATAMVGDACMSANVCGDGQACVGPSADMSACRTICTPGNAGECDDTTETCTQLNNLPYGACLPNA